MRKKILKSDFLVGQASLPVQSGDKTVPQSGTPPRNSYITNFSLTERSLPHWQAPGSIYFITFNTNNGFILDDDSKKIIYDSIIFHNKTKYTLFAFVIMDDHVHIILSPNEVEPEKYLNLSEIMHSIKSYSANEINKLLRRKFNEEHGQAGMPVPPEKIFQDESYDRIIRSEEELLEKMNYIFNNPIKKGLCEDGSNYKWFYTIGLNK